MKECLALFVLSYVVIFALYFILYYLRGLKKKTIMKSIQIEYLKTRFKINPKNLKAKKIGLVVCFIDPLIISLTGTIVTIPKFHYSIQLLLGFILLMALIFCSYEILGRILTRKKKGK